MPPARNTDGPASRLRMPGTDLSGRSSSALPTLAVTVVVVAGLYLGRQVLVPLALATLLSFALAPPVRWLRRWRVPNAAAVIVVVTLAFSTILAFGTIIGWQAADLAQRLPAYQLNIENKIEAIAQSPPGGHLFERAFRMVRNLGQKIQEVEDKASEETAPVAEEQARPMPVTVQRPSPTSFELIQSILGPLIRPLATAGIVVVFVIFLLLKREDLRDRFIRLLGLRDLPRTSRALGDAAQRVGKYLLMQLVVNTLYGIPIGIGLWFIGIPNPLLWGTLCTLLRFVPYIGPVIAAFFPLALSVAVDPGWTMLLMTGALFIVVELITNNLLEPWLYGASAGLSPIAVIVAAVFWTWLWGPLGLLLSTPLTVCLVVLGRHVPQLAFLNVLLGNDPALSPPERLYQRLLAGDPDDATERAEEYLRDHRLIDFYEEVAIPALSLAERDRARGSLDPERRARVAEGAMTMVEYLEDWEEDGRSEHEQVGSAANIDILAAPADTHQGDIETSAILCAGARGDLDDAAAAMLAQLLERRGCKVGLLPFDRLQGATGQADDMQEVKLVALSYMNADSMAHARYLVRRLRRRLPRATVVICFWTLTSEDAERREPQAATGADGVATTLADATAIIVKTITPDSTRTLAPEPAETEARAEALSTAR